MAEFDPEDEGITVIKEPSHERHLKKHGKPDTKSRIKDVILEVEEHGLMFTREEIVEHAKEKGIPAAEANAVIDELIAEGYLYYVRGTDKLLSRSVWQDFPHAFEEFPEY